MNEEAPSRRSGKEPESVPGGCKTHPGRPATHFCDGCGARLCGSCIDEGHRLTICKLCGELALPQGREFGGETRFRRAGQRSDPYRPARKKNLNIGSVLTYPLRGTGAWLFGVYIALAAIWEILGSFPLVKLALLPISIALPLMVGSLFLAIIRRTAAGHDEMPDWPDWDPQERLEDMLKLISVMIVALIPVVIALLIAGCFGSETPTRCVIAALVGSSFGAVFAVIALGAAAIYDDLMAAFRSS